jgi:hypothetical protein
LRTGKKFAINDPVFPVPGSSSAIPSVGEVSAQTPARAARLYDEFWKANHHLLTASKRYIKPAFLLNKM